MKTTTLTWHTTRDALPDEHEFVLYFVDTDGPEAKPETGCYEANLYDEPSFASSEYGELTPVANVTYWARFPKASELGS